MKWWIHLLTLLVSCSAESSQCPGSKASCPVAFTCCQIGKGTFGCCPIQNAVCCEDSKHCCPPGYSCDVNRGVCKMGSKLVPLLRKILATPTSNEIASKDVIVCPGGEGQCPTDHSCCVIPGGNQLHCCPLGYSCDKGICRETEVEFPAAMLITPSDKVVKCSQRFACPDRYTCCESSDSYRCCPLPEAVCCSDNKHCCPRGFKCSDDGKSCSSGSHSIVALSTATPKRVPKSLNELLQRVLKTVSKEWLSRTGTEQVKLSVPMTGQLLEKGTCPGGEVSCPSGQTCCKLASGQWGCCPLPKAVCCSDGVHCCPHDYTCDLANETCKRNSESIAILTNTAAKKSDRILCPDRISECPDNNTCCQLSTEKWACCPLPNAVCCADKDRCCPKGYTCDTPSGTCLKGTMSLPLSRKVPAFQRNFKLNHVCPDEGSECPDDYTCCKLFSGEYGCCPVPNAVCCSDGVHCCPAGYTCDISAGTCKRGMKTTPMLVKTPALKKTAQTGVICPGGESQCPDGTTCCKLSSGEYGCCPLPNAVCCSDGVHCCPAGYTCDISAGTCQRGMKTAPMLVKTPASKKTAQTGVICPDGESQCPDGTTCCKLSSGEYGCCPLPHAVCCSDEEHCCPEGYTCNVSAGTCNQERKTIPLLHKMPVIKEIVTANVVCPGGSTTCPDGYTCCKIASGGYGCCPFPDAVCCSDEVHCCPHGYTCDTANETCKRGMKTVPMLVKMPPSEKTAESNVICPDGRSQCPDGTTCCRLSSGRWGCCPLPDAVCCSDGVHCCPAGYTCDISAGTCKRGMKTAPMLVKTPALKKTAQTGVICPGGESQCPDGTTCCKLSSGEYGCCPLPNAVCCSDGVHCCPAGYTCDISAGTCQRGMNTAPMLVKTPASKKTAESNVICPDGRSQCPDGTTCCKLSSGRWGCCPLPDAVCCSDGVHCCPAGYTCDISAGTCKRGMKTAPMLVKIPALKKMAKVKMLQSNERRAQSFIGSAEFSGEVDTNSSGPVICPDKMYQCPNGNTCCRLHSGSYGCCPIEDAICCNDDKHCCPQGYKCDVKKGKCNKEGEQVSMIDNIPAVMEKTDASPSYIECADGSECLDYETCCEMPDGRYGCCPMPNAVCCEDKEHCCPCGYSCDLQSQTCVTGSKHFPMLTKTKSAHYRKTQEKAVGKKLHFSPGRPKDGKSVQSVDWL